jgi:DNA/RNA-binding domain of Phe-tRNA-synthetase-like protein
MSSNIQGLGEIVWRDNIEVTCRSWNWRQGPRTALKPETTSALFILGALSPLTNEALNTAAVELVSTLQKLGPSIQIEQRLIRASEGLKG